MAQCILAAIKFYILIELPAILLRGSRKGAEGELIPLEIKATVFMGELERTQSTPLHEGAGVRTIWHRFICVTDA